MISYRDSQAIRRRGKAEMAAAMGRIGNGDESMKLESRPTAADWAEFRRGRIADDLALGLSPEAAKAAAERAEAQMKARLDWLRGRYERAGELWDWLGDFWNDFFDAHPELDDEDPDPADLPPDPPEQEELEAIEAAIAAARDRDVWPRHLYFADV